MATTATTPTAFPRDNDNAARSAFPSTTRATPRKPFSSEHEDVDAAVLNYMYDCNGGSSGSDPATRNDTANTHTDSMNDDDAAAASLQLQYEQSIHLLRARRPLLHHLSAGPSWLLQLPRPVAATRRGARGFYNVLVNPRFAGRGAEEGGQAQSWVARAMGRGKSVGGVGDVQELIGDVERLTTGRGARGIATETAIDAVVVSTPGELSRHERDALLQIDRDVPVFALEEALPGIKALDRFRHVAPIPPFSRHDPDWRAASLPPLPEWLAVSRLEPPLSNDAATTTQKSPSSSSPPPSSTSNPPALLFAFAVPSPADRAARRACAPSSCATAAASKTQLRGGDSARALLHHNGWAPAGSTAEGAECIVFATGSAKARDQQTKRGAVGSRGGGKENNDDDDDDTLLSPDAIRAVAYARPTLAVAAVMAPGAGSHREHARAQRLLRASYWIDVGDGDGGDGPEAARQRRSTRDADAWVRVHGKAGATGADARRGAAARWYTPWRWPGAGVRWLAGRGGGAAGGAGDGRAGARGKKRGLDESDEDEDEEGEDDDESSGDSENEVLKDDATRVEEEEEEEQQHGAAIVDDTADPWAGVQRCRLGDGESIVLS